MTYGPVLSCIVQIHRLLNSRDSVHTCIAKDVVIHSSSQSLRVLMSSYRESGPKVVV